jgi:DNA-binding response OmpR family regulator
VTDPTGSAPDARGLVLVVEDEEAIADIVRRYLTREGFGVHVESDGLRGLEAVRSLHPVAVVLDVGLPSMDGTAVCRALRAESNWTPILFVTARDDEVDRVLGLEIGGDDYITKPFSPRELVARVRSVLRRQHVQSGHEDSQSVSDVTLDPRSRRVTVGGDEVSLTATEFSLLEHLMRAPGRVFSREQLLAEVWGYSAAIGTRTVDVHVAQLRSKLGRSELIRTVRGVGYAVEAEGPGSPVGQA